MDIYINLIAQYAEKANETILNGDWADTNVDAGTLFFETSQQLLSDFRPGQPFPHACALLTIAAAAFGVATEQFDGTDFQSARFLAVATRNLKTAIETIIKHFPIANVDHDNSKVTRHLLNQLANFTVHSSRHQVPFEDALELRDQWETTFRSLLTRNIHQAKSAFDHAMSIIRKSIDPDNDDTDFRGMLLMIRAEKPFVRLAPD